MVQVSPELLETTVAISFSFSHRNLTQLLKPPGVIKSPDMTTYLPSKLSLKVNERPKKGL